MSILFAIHLYNTKEIISEMSESTKIWPVVPHAINKTDTKPFKAPSTLERNFYQIIPILKQFSQNTYYFQ